MRVVVVEDHQDLRQVFTQAISREGVDVLAASCGEELDEFLALGGVQLLVLDINLPGESGFDIAKRVRAADPNVSIIMLSARTAESDRLQGYQCGADFFLCKPVSPSELSAAVNAAKRRLEASHSFGDLVLSERGMTLTSAEGVARLGRADVMLLKALAMAPDGRLPYWRLFEVTGRDSQDSAKTQLELQVFRLRKKVADISVPEEFIKSMRTEGYQLTRRIRVDP
jgi:DNA-binding response OmpR family regulator